MLVVCNGVKVLYFNEIIKIALSGRVSDVCFRDAFVRADDGVVCGRAGAVEWGRNHPVAAASAGKGL